MVRVIALLLALSFLAGCGSDGGAGPDEGGAAEVELEGRTFSGEPVSGRELVGESQLTVTFEDGGVGLDAGCNSMSAPYELAEGRLELTGQMVQTLMGCPERLERQDEWLIEFFKSGPAVEAAGDDGASLKSEAVEIVLTPK